MMLLDQQEAMQVHGAKSITGPSAAQNVQGTEAKDSNNKAYDPDFNFEHPTQGGGARVHPALERPARGSDSKEITATSLQYVLEVRRLLYLTEFLVLINYVGVFIPLIFSIYMDAMYRLPNRLYYAQLADLTLEDLNQALNKVMFNCSLKLISLLLLCAVLQYRLRFSAIRQLAFVLERQWPGVQTKICFWVFYNVQASLKHHGYDYTFKFAWLTEDSASIASNSTGA